jgi:L-ascorbate metabolism protein UlaG (beta-lactamase superfamily)
MTVNSVSLIGQWFLKDPDGTRVLYDAGFTVRGPDDPRLGKIDGVLLSHVHGDHLGPAHSSVANAGDCGQPKFDIKDAPSSNTEKIVVAKKAKFFVGGEMNSWFGKRIPAAGGGKEQVIILRFGATSKLGGVSIWSVPAAHSNGIAPAFLSGDIAKEMEANGLTAYIGPPGGYVLRCSNGLTVYLSGDTGVIADQELVIRRQFHATLAVLNIGNVFTTGPTEAAYVINELVKPNAVIASHANEVATKNGKLLPNTKTANFQGRNQSAGIPTIEWKNDGIRRRRKVSKRLLKLLSVTSDSFGHGLPPAITGPEGPQCVL